MNPEDFWRIICKARLSLRKAHGIAATQVVVGRHFMYDPIVLLSCAAMQYDMKRVSRVMGMTSNHRLKRPRQYWEDFESQYEMKNGC